MALTVIQPSGLNQTATYTVGNMTVTSNVTAGNVKSDNLLYANGDPYVFTTNAAGSNTQIQFNDSNSFAGNASLTFNKTTSTLTSTYFSGNGNSLSNITGANVTGAVSYATTANSVAGGNVSGAVAYATTANSVAGGNVTGQVGNALVAGTVYTNAQPNITSVGTLTSLDVTSNIAAANINITGTANFTSSGNVNLGDVGNIHIDGGQDGQILITDGTGNLQWVDNTPSTTTYIANSISLLHGVYVTGDLYSVQVFGDYNEPDGVYTLTDGTGVAPAWIFSVGFTGVTNFNQVQMNINYTATSGHTIYVQLYNYATSFTLPSATVTTTSGTNYVTVSSTADMYVGQTLIFGNDVGGLTAGTLYYVLSIVNGTTITVGAGTGSGSIITLSTDSVSTTVEAQNYDNIGTYTGLGYYYAFALDVIDDTNYINAGAVDLRLFHSNQGNASHVTNIDYVALVLSNQGPQGPKGPTGNTGATGAGVATGGTSGQILTKNSSTNYDTVWSSSLNLSGNIDVDGNTHIGGNLTVIGNIDFTGNGSINQITGNSGQFFGNAQGIDALYAGLETGYAVVYNPVIQASADANAYVQLNFQNINHGNQSSTDFCATSDNGDDTKYFIDMGIAGGSWDGTQDNSIGDALYADDGYLYVQGYSNVGNLVIGTVTPSASLKFLVGGPGAANIVSTISNTGANFNNINTPGNLSVDGIVDFTSTSNVSLGAVGNLHITGGSNGYVLTTDGSGNLSFAEATSGTTTVATVDSFTGDGSTTSFTLSVIPTTVNATTVNYNGATLLKSTYSIIGSDIVFSSAPANGSLIEVSTLIVASVPSVTAGTYVTRAYTGDGSTTSFNVTSGMSSNSVIVSENGVVQAPSVDFNVSGTSLTFTTAPANGVAILITELAVNLAAANSVSVSNEGTELTASVNSIDFVGDGVTATHSGDAVTVTVPGGVSTGKAIAMAIVFGF